MENCDILIKNTNILDESMKIQSRKTLVISDGKIKSIKENAAGYQAKETIEGTDLLIIPGLTDAHMHTCQQLLRGRILDELPMIWTRIMVPFESSLTKEDVRLSASLCSLEMMKNGTTSFLDAGGIHMEQAAQIYMKSGLRGGVTCSTMDDKKVPNTMRADAKEAVKLLDNLYQEFNQTANGRLKVFYSLRSLISCSEELIELVFGAAQEKNAPVEAHMNEYANEINFFLEHFGLRPIEYLDQKGYLNERFVSAHSIMLSETEMDILEKNKSKVVHCPFSNCGKGIPNTPALLQRSIPVALGSDGTAHGGMDLFQEMKIFRSVMNVHYGTAFCNPAIMPAETILKMAFEGGSQALMSEDHIGKIKEGYQADIIAINLNAPHLYPTNNLVHTLLESVKGSDVCHMIVDGNVIMKDREILTLDEEKIRFEAKAWMRNNNKTEDQACFS